jgi:hypothetical protein
MENQLQHNGSREKGSQTPSAEAEQHSEGRVAQAIEPDRELPSDTFLWASERPSGIAAPANLRQEAQTFVGQWAPTFLILGLYNKLVKVGGSDRTVSARPA